MFFHLDENVLFLHQSISVPLPITVIPCFSHAKNIRACGFANASRSHSKLRTRSPLFYGLCAGNRRPGRFRQRNSGRCQFMHSHANAQNLSGAIFGVQSRQMCCKQPARAKMPLRGAEAVPVRDVMFNSTAWHIQKRPPVGDLFWHFLLRPSVICTAQRSCERHCRCWPQ